MSVVSLIDKATQTVGSRYKLAKKLDVSANRVNDWYHKRVTCSPADMARIAHAANMSTDAALETLVEYTIQAHEGTERGDQLKSIFSAWLNENKTANEIGFESTFDRLMRQQLALTL